LLSHLYSAIGDLTLWSDKNKWKAQRLGEKN
jgi:hypothetical protein